MVPDEVNDDHGSLLRVGLVYDDSVDRDGGVAQYIGMLARGLRLRGHSVTMLVGDSPNAAAAEAAVLSLSRNAPVRMNGGRFTTPVRVDMRRLRETITKECFDVVHVQVPFSPLLAGSVVRMVSPATAVIGTCHPYAERWTPRNAARIWWRLNRQSLRRFDRMIAVSEPAAEFAREYLGAVCDLVIPNMVVVDESRPAFRADSTSSVPHIVYVGALVPRKGVDGLIEALPYLIERRAHIRLIIAGDGPLADALRRRARRLGVEDHIWFAGRVTEADKRALLADAEIACMPSRYGESFGVTLIEAIAAGSDVVVGGRNPGHRSVLGREDVLVEPDDPRGLAARLHDLLADQGLRARIGAQQRQLLGSFNSESVVERLLTVYRAALLERAPRRVTRDSQRERLVAVEASL